MLKNIRSTLAALAILMGSTACAIVPLPHYGHHDRHIDRYETRSSDHSRVYRHDREAYGRRERY